MRALLADKRQVTQILQSAREVSEALHRPDLPVPAGGFAQSPVFDPATPIAARLRAEHEAAMRDLYYGAEAPPSYEEIIERVHADAELLAT